MKDTYQLLYDEYMERYPHMPITHDIARDFVKHLPDTDVPIEDIKRLADRLYDYVGSQGLYEQGAEEEW